MVSATDDVTEENDDRVEEVVPTSFVIFGEENNGVEDVNEGFIACIHQDTLNQTGSGLEGSISYRRNNS